MSDRRLPGSSETERRGEWWNLCAQAAPAAAAATAAAGSLTVYSPPYFFQVMSLLVSEGAVNCAGSIHCVRMGTTQSSLDVIPLTKYLTSEFNTELGWGNGWSSLIFPSVFGLSARLLDLYERHSNTALPGLRRSYRTITQTVWSISGNNEWIQIRSQFLHGTIDTRSQTVQNTMPFISCI
jgi:hypothetical protein